MVVSLIKSIPLIILLVSIDFGSKRFFYNAGNIVLNDGISFGLFPGNNALMITISLFAIGLFCAMLSLAKNNMSLYSTSLIFMISGALGNLVDRIQIGAVIDFIRIGNFPVFNFADSYLTIGVLLMMIVTFFPKRKHGHSSTHHHKKHSVHKKHINVHRKHHKKFKH